MTFLAMVIALLLFQIWGAGNSLQQDHWFLRLQSSTRSWGFSPAIALFIYILIPVLVTGLVLNAVEGLLFGLLWIAAAAVILIYSFGRSNHEALFDRYYSYCMGGDFEAAQLFAQSELGVELEDESVDSQEGINQLVERELLYLGYQRWFAVLFYFVVFGPIGALVYRLLQHSTGTPEREQAVGLLYYADWIPARLLAAGFALTGDFMASRDQLISTLSGPNRSAGAVLLEVGKAAIGRSETVETDNAFSVTAAQEVAELRALLSRSAGAWLLVISLLVLFW
jgi:AmpE protein